MSSQLISIYALVAMFVIATIVPINMGVLAFVGAYLVGTLVAGMATKDIIAGFPAFPHPGRHHLSLCHRPE